MAPSTTTTTPIKLTYFELAGRAELTRILFAFGGVPFEDFRFTFADYGAAKPSLNLPYGQLPTLQVGDKVYGQSLAIARYAAKKAGLYPQDELVALHADSIVDAIVEIYNATYPVLFGGLDDETKKTKLQNLNEVVFPTALERLNKQVHGTYFVGEDLTYADIYLYDVVENHLGGFPGDISVKIDAFPKLQAIVNRVKADERLRGYFTAKATQ